MSGVLMMLEPSHNSELPPIPSKRYFTIGEVSDLCAVKPHVLRYWEQEFPQLKPVKRRGNRRYYQRADVEMIRTIRSLLYEQGYTIGGARQRMVQEKEALTPLRCNRSLGPYRGSAQGPGDFKSSCLTLRSHGLAMYNPAASGRSAVW